MAVPYEAIILDIGSGETKFGFGGETSPRGSFPTIVGVPQSHVKKDLNLKDFYVGNEALFGQDFSTLKSPIKYGTVLDWRDVDRIWSHIFDDRLKVSAEDYYILYSEPPINAKRNREATLQRIFEKWNARGAFAGLSPVLGLYANGRTTGFVIDSGEGQTFTVPVVDGNILIGSVQLLQVGGRDLTEYLATLLRRKGFEFTTPAEKHTLKKIKEELGYVATNLPEEVQLARDTSRVSRGYTLPDGRRVQLDAERFLCAEPLFQPSLIGVEQRGVADVTVAILSQCEPHLRDAMLENIVFSGGNTMFPRMDRRFERELSQGAHRSVAVAKDSFADRKHATWIGASILSVMPTLRRMWITRSDYDEMGPEIVHHKCF